MRTKTWSKRKLILFSVITCLVFLLVAEIISRVVFYINYHQYHTTVYIQGSSLEMSDPALVFRNRPLYLDYEKHYQFNEEGMRENAGNIYMPAKKENDFWVFLFGASAMEGMGSNKDGEWLDITGVTDYPANETIASYLQKILQASMPGKEVRVFNAANSGFILEQTVERYRQLAARYQMDWVISLDGQNEPAALGPGQTPLDIVRNDWNNNALFQFPLKIIIPITSHSALAGQFKQAIFHTRLSARLAKNEEKDYPRRKYWSAAVVPALKLVSNDPDIHRSVETFYHELLQFDSLLASRQQHHLLLIQPHLTLRDTSLFNETEKALFNYYRSAYNDSLHNSFLKELYASYKTYTDSSHSSIRLLNEFNQLPRQVFVDYCHFTKEINEYLAKRIADYIITSGH